MHTRRTALRALAFAVLVPASLRPASGQPPAEPRGGQSTPAEPLDTTIEFSFEIPDVVTNHQFEGQRNSFSVTYEYAAVLRDGSFDPTGHVVAADAFPYFQMVRDDILDYVRRYPARSDFYEEFARNIAQHVMERYVQFRRIELTVQVPAFASVASGRSVMVRLARRNREASAMNEAAAGPPGSRTGERLP